MKTVNLFLVAFFSALSMLFSGQAHADVSVLDQYVNVDAKAPDGERILVLDRLVQSSKGKTYHSITIRLYHMEGYSVIDDGKAGDFMLFGRTLKRYGSIDQSTVTANLVEYSGSMATDKGSVPFHLKLTPSGSGYHLSVSAGALQYELDLLSGVLINP